MQVVDWGVINHFLIVCNNGAPRAMGEIPTHWGGPGNNDNAYDFSDLRLNTYEHALTREDVMKRIAKALEDGDAQRHLERMNKELNKD